MNNGKARVVRASGRFIEVYVPDNKEFIRQAKEKYLYRDRGWWRLDIRQIVNAHRPLTRVEIDQLEREQAQELLDLVGRFYEIEESPFLLPAPGRVVGGGQQDRAVCWQP